MNKDVGIGLLLVFLQWITQPILLGICARKIYDRSGIFWGLLAFGINVGLLMFFESHLASSHIDADRPVVAGIVMGLSAILILAIFEAFRGGTRNLRRGLFRIWITIFTVWTVFCAIEFHEYSRYSCYYLRSVLFSICFENYLDVARWFIAIPAFVFMIGLAAYWVVEGFRRSAPN